MRMMARLVSEDNEVVMEVPTGETVLGRGPLLGVGFNIGTDLQHYNVGVAF